MRIEPQATNAIRITLEDGYTYDLHSTVHGIRSYLYISPSLVHQQVGGYAIEVAQLGTAHPIEWKPIATIPALARLHIVRRTTT